MTTAFLTGITGQDGLYRSELLLRKGYEVYGLIRGRTTRSTTLSGGRSLTQVPERAWRSLVASGVSRI